LEGRTGRNGKGGGEERRGNVLLRIVGGRKGGRLAPKTKKTSPMYRPRSTWLPLPPRIGTTPS